MGKPLETSHFVHRCRRPTTWGFSNGTQATRVYLLTIAAGGLQAKGRLRFKMDVFGAIELPRAACRALWNKNKNSRPEFEKFLKLSQPLSPKQTNATSHHSARLGSKRHQKLSATEVTRQHSRRHRVEIGRNPIIYNSSEIVLASNRKQQCARIAVTAKQFP